MILSLGHGITACAFLKYETKDQAICAIEALNGVYKMEVFYLFSAASCCT